MRILGDRILILPDEAKTETDSGIHIPLASVITPSRGTVIEAGPGIENPNTGIFKPTQIKKGDVVMWQENASSVFPVVGHLFGVDAEKVVIVRESDIISVED
jgi:chaperonin GroES